jgi:hypothetical protein
MPYRPRFQHWLLPPTCHVGAIRVETRFEEKSATSNHDKSQNAHRENREDATPPTVISNGAGPFFLPHSLPSEWVGLRIEKSLFGFVRSESRLRPTPKTRRRLGVCECPPSLLPDAIHFFFDRQGVQARQGQA